MRRYTKEEFMKYSKHLYIRSSEGSHREPIHTHDFIEIVYVTGGSATEIVNDGEYEVKRGDLIFINYRSTHRFSVHDELSYINICFKPEAVADKLITPENAFALLAEMDDARAEIVKHCFQVIPTLEKALGLEDGYRVIINQGENGGQTVHHLHVHLLGGEPLGDF